MDLNIPARERGVEPIQLLQNLYNTWRNATNFLPQKRTIKVSYEIPPSKNADFFDIHGRRTPSPRNGIFWVRKKDHRSGIESVLLLR